MEQKKYIAVALFLFFFQPWCPTSLDSNGNYVAGQWGYCSANCLLELPDCRTVDGPVVRDARADWGTGEWDDRTSS